MGKRARKPATRGRARPPARPTPPDVFSGESVNRRFVPWADVLGELDLKTGRAAMVARRAFMELLVEDPRVIALLTEWVRRLRSDPDGFTTDDILPFARDELGLRWPWCLVEILDTFNRAVQLKVSPLEALPPMVGGIQAPTLVVNFATEEGEPIDDAKERLTELYHAAIAELDAAKAAVRRGIAPKSDPRRWAQWFYAVHVAPVASRKSINALAKESGVDRKTIRDSIRKAERLLRAGECSLPLGGKRDP